ncbi:MAG: hypothetical protein IPP43_00615 [Chitinophagaceae bacterium]|nr:hypothetical protein [Chitinophagaceae bacterium]
MNASLKKQMDDQTMAPGKYAANTRHFICFDQPGKKTAAIINKNLLAELTQARNEQDEA